MTPTLAQAFARGFLGVSVMDARQMRLRGSRNPVLQAAASAFPGEGAIVTSVRIVNLAILMITGLSSPMSMDAISALATIR